MYYGPELLSFLLGFGLWGLFLVDSCVLAICPPPLVGTSYFLALYGVTLEPADIFPAPVLESANYPKILIPLFIYPTSENGI